MAKVGTRLVGWSGIGWNRGEDGSASISHSIADLRLKVGWWIGLVGLDGSVDPCCRRAAAATPHPIDLSPISRQGSMLPT